MSGERLLAIHLETVHGRKDANFVVQTLARQPFTVWRQRNRWHRVHRRIGNVLHVDRYVPFPNAHTFVVGRRDKSAIFVDKRDGVDRS